jgi:uncharacterized NAD(P)/FAD-binding protein YdhS
MKNYIVTMMDGLSMKKVTITLGDKSDSEDVVQALRRQGHRGEIIMISSRESIF